VHTQVSINATAASSCTGRLYRALIGRVTAHWLFCNWKNQNFKQCECSFAVGLLRLFQIQLEGLLDFCSLALLHQTIVHGCQCFGFSATSFKTSVQPYFSLSLTATYVKERKTKDGKMTAKSTNQPSHKKAEERTKRKIKEAWLTQQKNINIRPKNRQLKNRQPRQGHWASK